MHRFWHASHSPFLCDQLNCWNLAWATTCRIFLVSDKMKEGRGGLFWNHKICSRYHGRLETTRLTRHAAMQCAMRFCVRLLMTLPSFGLIMECNIIQIFRWSAWYCKACSSPTHMLDAGFQSARMTVLMQQSFKGLNLNRNSFPGMDPWLRKLIYCCSVCNNIFNFTVQENLS